MKKVVFSLTILALLAFAPKAQATYCFTSMSGDKTISGDCTLKTYTDGSNANRYVSGIDSGTGSTNTAKMTVSSGTVTVNSNETLVAGSLDLSGGSIAIASGAKIEIGKPMWVIDADGDGYPSSTKIYVQTTPPTNGRRLNLDSTALTNNQTDCNDSNGNLNLSCVLAFGDGHDGNVTIAANTNINATNRISGRSCADGGDAVNYSVTGLGSNYATLSTTPSSGCLNSGDEALLINLQGTSSYYTNVGNYEIVQIDHVSGNTVYFKSAKTKHYGNSSSNDSNLGTSTSNQRVMLQRLPNYNNLTINSGVYFYPSAWNGVKGGVIAFKVKGTLTVNGTIHTNYLGYRGGSGNTGGESFCALHGGGTGGSCGNTNAGPGSAGVCGGGGGGSALSYSGGAGSSTGGAGGGGGGGVKAHGGNNYGGGGGGGGYGSGGTGGRPDSGIRYSSAYGTNGGTNTSGAGGKGYGYKDSQGAGGGGGGTYGSATLSKLYFGSGGGAGACAKYGGSSRAGGKGGGIIYIMAQSIAVNGYIKSMGQKGANHSDWYANSHTENFSGGGGGGAGGSIKIVANSASLNSSHVLATGGNKGSNYGGVGGVGRIRVEANSIYGTTNPAASTGAGP